jgi:hypothetical protein
MDATLQSAVNCKPYGIACTCTGRARQPMLADSHHMTCKLIAPRHVILQHSATPSNLCTEACIGRQVPMPTARAATPGPMWPHTCHCQNAELQLNAAPAEKWAPTSGTHGTCMPRT